MFQVAFACDQTSYPGALLEDFQVLFQPFIWLLVLVGVKPSLAICFLGAGNAAPAKTHRFPLGWEAGGGGKG